jgi:hypothetical protein
MVDIPPTAKKVELRSIATGHGGVMPGTCLEFCDVGHEWTVGGATTIQDVAKVNDSTGCMKQIDRGVVPNQSGTWWLGRNGWCPGAQVDPWTQDFTAAAKPGSTTSVGYRLLWKGKPPTTNVGDIDLSAWLVIWE